MKIVKLIVFVLILTSVAAFALPLGSSARAVIPSDLQQLICVDYRALRNSETAQALKAQVLPDSLKEFESALKGVGIDPDKDVDQLTFASYRTAKKDVRIVGIAQGTFPTKVFLKKMRLQKVKPFKVRNSDLWPMNSGMQMTFLDDNTLLFGDRGAIQGALDTRDGYSNTLDTNNQVADMIGNVDSGTVWSVLDQRGTQNMVNSILGDASKLGDYDTIKKRLVGSRYTMNFNDGVNLDLDVITSDSTTAALLSTLAKGAVLYRKINATPTEKLALESVTFNSDSSNLQMHFKTDDKKFQSLLHSELFAAVSK
jgi:hypothetical protein